jgi:hypothetical protein
LEWAVKPQIDRENKNREREFHEFLGKVRFNGSGPPSSHSSDCERSRSPRHQEQRVQAQLDWDKLCEEQAEAQLARVERCHLISTDFLKEDVALIADDLFQHCVDTIRSILQKHDADDLFYLGVTKNPKNRSDDEEIGH